MVIDALFMQPREMQDSHALHAHLEAAIAAAERLETRHPDDRAMERLSLYLYDAMELLDARGSERGVASTE